MITPETFHPLHDVVNAELRSGEKVLWIGQPSAKRIAMQEVVPFALGIPWTLASIVPAFPVAPKSSGMLLFQIPFVYVGLVMMCAPLRSYADAKKAVYVLT